MKNDNWMRLYAHQADLYERLVAHEDVQGNLLPALLEICPLAGAVVVEFGAGTGRVTAQLLPLARRVWAFDLTPGMLQIARQKLGQRPYSNYALSQSDSRAMPLPTACADVAVEGWAFLQIKVWHPDNWEKALDEMLRVLRPGGTALLIETLGTGETTPNPPPAFKSFYEYLEQKRGFMRRWIRTDYLFPSLTAAAEIVPPFFGEAMLDALIPTAQGALLPECTGIWWRTV